MGVVWVLFAFVVEVMLVCILIYYSMLAQRTWFDDFGMSCLVSILVSCYRDNVHIVGVLVCGFVCVCVIETMFV